MSENIINKNSWYSIPGFPNYEINGKGIVRYLNGKELRLIPGKGYSLYRNREQRYIRSARLLYAVSHGICPTEVKGAVVLNVGESLKVMTRTEYIHLVNQKRKRGLLSIGEAQEYYRKAVAFSTMMLRYYETRDLTDVASEISKYENEAKCYIRKMNYSINRDTINESWDEIYFNILTKITEGRISIIEPRSYIFKSIRVYFTMLRKSKSRIVSFNNLFKQISRDTL